MGRMASFVVAAHENRGVFSRRAHVGHGGGWRRGGFVIRYRRAVVGDLASCPVFEFCDYRPVADQRARPRAG